MKIFDGKGMLLIPTPVKREAAKGEKVLVVRDCFCPQGHSLISRRALFNGYPGILLRIRGAAGEGLLALSPVYGEKSRVTLDVEVEEGLIYEMLCPQCGMNLPVFATCRCGGDIVTLFTTRTGDVAHCIGICNRAGCMHSEVRSGDVLLEQAMIDTFDELTI